jgi:hypothetical protein
MLDTIESDVVYDHERHGEVLVTAVGEMYGEYPLSGGRGEPGSQPNSRLVFYYNNFDGYGGMNPSPMTQEVTEFARQADRIRPHEYLGSELRED